MINIVLFQPEIPQNTGNIIRTAMATNAKLHLIKPLGFSLDEKNLKRSGMDYIKDVDIIYYENIDEFLNTHRTSNIVFLTRYAQKTYSSFDYSNPLEDIYLVFGRESTGIPHEVLRKYPDSIARIPMVPNARSLNLSNTVAIVVYEALRQQHFYELSTYEAIKGAEFLEKEIKSEE